jgi:hypothetical protein
MRLTESRVTKRSLDAVLVDEFAVIQESPYEDWGDNQLH